VQTWLPIAYVLFEWGIRVVMLPIALRRRRPASAMAWLLLIFLLPIVGLVMYTLIGRQRLGRRRTRLAARAHDVIERTTAREQPHRVRAGHPDVNRRQHDLIAVAERVGEVPIIGGNALEGTSDTADAVKRIIEDIEHAEHHVHVLMYIFGNDRTGSAVGGALLRAVQRGVRCRVLVDAVGSKAMLEGLAHELRKGGVEVVAMLPVNIVRLLLSRLDIRNHRKLVVIDGRIAWAGSMNIVDADYGQKRIGAWKDVMLRLRGPVVPTLQRVFLEDWYAETGHVLELEGAEGVLPLQESVGQSPVQVVPSGPHLRSRALQDLYLAGIQEAEERLVITSPYFVPDEPVTAALRVAVMRGVTVDIIVPRRGNNPIVNAASWAYFRDLVEAGVNVHMHRVGLLHAKTMTVDDSFTMVGSSNFDIRSFDINFELNLLLFGPEVTARVRALQERYKGESDPLTHEEASNVGRVRRFTEEAARLFSPLL